MPVVEASLTLSFLHQYLVQVGDDGPVFHLPLRFCVYI